MRRVIGDLARTPTTPSARLVAPDLAAVELHAVRMPLAGIALISLIAVVLLPPLFAMRVDFVSFAPIVLLALCAAIFWPYVAWRRMTPMQAAIEAGGSALLLGIPLLVLSYVAMRSALPLADERLAAWDAELGFHAPDFVRWIDGHAALSRALGFAYSSFTLQIVLIPALLCGLGNYARGYAAVFGMILICLISSVACAFFPSIGTFDYYGVEVSELTHINGNLGYHFLESFNAVRADAFYTLRLESAAGIVTFPSIHAAVAILCGWAAWSAPPLRWPVFALNCAMFVSALSHGAHYLVDLLGGIVVAVVTILATKRVYDRLNIKTVIAAPSPRPTLSPLF